MKTKDQIIDTLKESDSNISGRIERYVDEATEGLNQYIKLGYQSYDEIIMNGSYNQAVHDCSKVAMELNRMGFYATIGVMETTPNGNERPFVRVRLHKANVEHGLIYKIFHSIF
jgi:hypothetical protein